MKKFLVVGLSACLLFSFAGSAFAASQTNAYAKKKVVHVAASSKKANVHTLAATKKKAATPTAASSKKTATQAKKHAVKTSSIKAKTIVHKKTAVQP